MLGCASGRNCSVWRLAFHLQHVRLEKLKRELRKLGRASRLGGIMALQIIGSGFGRTGTMSTKMALEQRGFGPCHHMIEVIESPAQPAHWKAIGAGEKVVWAEVFDGYKSQVDWPG